MNIGFIGLGKLGLPCALAVASKGHNVFGYDINANVLKILKSKKLPYLEKGTDKLIKTEKINFTDINNVVSNADLIFVSIQTPHDYEFEGCTRIPNIRKNFNYEYLKKGIKDVSECIKKQNKNKILIIISTVLPGTIENEILPIIKNNSKIKIIYNPFFIAMGTTMYDFLNPEFVLIGCNDENKISNKLKKFYSTIHNKKIWVTSIKNAELVKVSYNTFIGMKVIFANTLMEISHKIGANVDEVTTILSDAKDRIISSKYLKGGMGDGGGCHPRDNIAMSWLANNLKLSYNFFEDIMKGRELQTDFLVSLIKQNSGPYYIFGKTYKEETNLINGSPSILLSNILKEQNINHIHYDPFVDEFLPKLKKGTYFIATKHKIFNSIKYPKGSVIIDVWRYLKIKQKNITHIKVGNGKHPQ